MENEWNAYIVTSTHFKFRLSTYHLQYSKDFVQNQPLDHFHLFDSVAYTNLNNSPNFMVKINTSSFVRIIIHTRTRNEQLFILF